MKKTVVLVGSLDTKGAEYEFVKQIIEHQGIKTLTVDFGIMREPTTKADVSREKVIDAGGGDLQHLASGKHKDEAMRVVTKGVGRIVEGLYKDGKLDGILGMGGSGGTSVATSAMRSLPVGIPKVMVSTVGGGDVSAYAGTKDIVFIPSVVDVAGLNRISRKIFTNAAGAVAGMVKTAAPESATSERPLIAATMFGNTTPAVTTACEVLAKRGYEPLIFHCTGIGGRTMESLVYEKYVAGVLDITTTELADYVCGGVFSAGKDRCMAAAKSAIPCVLVPGCVDMANFGGVASVPQKYQGRTLYEWNPDVTLLRTNVEENVRIGKMIAEAANNSLAATTILLPLKGVSMLDSEGERFWDPEADHACFDAIKDNVNPSIPVIESNHNINDPAFATKAAESLLAMLAD